MAVALIPICWSDSFLRIRTEPIASTSSWLYASLFQPITGPLMYVWVIAWLGASIYAQWLLWPHRRIPSQSSRGTRINMVWLSLFCWGAFGLIESILASFDDAGVDPVAVIQTGSIIGLAVALAKEPGRGLRTTAEEPATNGAAGREANAC